MKGAIVEFSLGLLGLIAAFLFWPNPFGVLLMGIGTGWCFGLGFALFDLRNTDLIRRKC